MRRFFSIIHSPIPRRFSAAIATETGLDDGLLHLARGNLLHPPLTILDIALTSAVTSRVTWIPQSRPGATTAD